MPVGWWSRASLKMDPVVGWRVLCSVGRLIRRFGPLWIVRGVWSYSLPSTLREVTA